MTERAESAGSAPMPTAAAPLAGGKTAGQQLREARERQGLHIAVLAAAIKVSARKLDALENDRYHELPDITFTRALTQTVCRALKINPLPVLSQLPAPKAEAFDSRFGGLNMPFKGTDSQRGGWLPSWVPRAPLLWAAVGLLVLAGLVLYWPAGGNGSSAGLSVGSAASAVSAVLPPLSDVGATPAGNTPSPANSASSVTTAVSAMASSEAAVPAPVVAPGAGAAPGAVADLAARPPALPPAVMPSAQGASLSVSEPVWVELTDGTGNVLFQRTVQPGETMNFDHRPPLKLRIGNAAAARLSWRGEPVDLTPVTKANVARLELK
jgi:cytoskeleton protein RodZ